MTSIATGDWLRIPSLWPGIWRVSRVLTGFKEDRWSLDEPLKPSERSIVFCHRIVNETWQRSFSHQSCEISFVRQPSSDDREKLKSLLASDTKLLAAFEKYRTTTKTNDLVANVGFGELSAQQASDFPRLCDEMLAGRIDTGLTMDEVLRLLRENSLDSYKHKFPQQTSLQLTSVNHELLGDRFLYKRYRTLAF